TFTNNYCGGARPTPEIEKALNTPKDLSEFYILLENKKQLKVKTDSTGNFKATLKTGAYKIYLTNRVNPALFANYTPTCEKMLHTPYGKLLIEKGKSSYDINLHFPCNPCEPNNKP